VLVALAGETSRPDAERIADGLRARGIATEVSATAQKYGRQIRYAERRGIPFVWFPASEPGVSDQVKDIRSGDQVDADAARWMPPEADLRPTIVTPDSQETP
jgi:histidyl-tRNA synthetase